MTLRSGVGPASWVLVGGLILTGCGHGAPSTREVVAVVNVKGDPNLERVRMLAREFPQGHYRFRPSPSPDFKRDFKIGGPLQPQPQPVSGEASLSWTVPKSRVSIMVKRLRAEPYVLKVSVSG